jgi:hypothetical protein
VRNVTLFVGGNLNVQTKASAAGSCEREGWLGVFLAAVLGPGRTSQRHDAELLIRVIGYRLEASAYTSGLPDPATTQLLHLIPRLCVTALVTLARSNTDTSLCRGERLDTRGGIDSARE